MPGRRETREVRGRGVKKSREIFGRREPRRKGAKMDAVEVREPGRASIITLMIKQVMDRNLLDPRKRQLMRNRALTVHLRVRDMRTTLFFEATRVRAEDGAHGKPDLEIVGDMKALLAVALGAGPLGEMWRGRLKIRPRRWRGIRYGARLLLMMQLGDPPFYLRWLVGKLKSKENTHDAGDRTPCAPGRASDLPGQTSGDRGP